MCASGFSADHQPACSGVQAMYGAGPGQGAWLRGPLKVPRQGMLECAVFVAAGGQAWWFLDHSHVGILIDYGNGPFVDFRCTARGREKLEQHAFFEKSRPLYGASVEEHLVSFDGLSCSGSGREPAQCVGQVAVEPDGLGKNGHRVLVDGHKRGSEMDIPNGFWGSDGG